MALTPQCILAASKALGKALSAREQGEIEKRLNKAAQSLARQDPNAWMAKSPETQKIEAAELAAKQIDHELSVQKRRVALTVLASDRVDQHSARMAKKGIDSLDALERTVNPRDDMRSDFLSAESRGNAIRNIGWGRALQVWDQMGSRFGSLFTDPAKVADLTHALYGEKAGKDASEAAKVFHEVAEMLRERANDSGADIHHLEDWSKPTDHSPGKIHAAGIKEWAADTMQWLKRDWYVNADGTRMNDVEVFTFLTHAWETLVTGGATKHDEGFVKSNSALANYGSASRQIHFRDADAAMAYHAKYGERPLYEVLLNHINKLSKVIGALETYGPNPEVLFKAKLEKAYVDAKLAREADIDTINAKKARVEALFNATVGHSEPIANARAANVWSAARSWMIATRGGAFSLASMFGDKATMQAIGRMNDLPMLKVFKSAWDFFKPWRKEDISKLALRNGLGITAYLGDLQRLGDDLVGSDWTRTAASYARSLASITMRVSLMNRTNFAHRAAFGAHMMANIGELVRHYDSVKALGAVDEDGHQIAAVLGSKAIPEAVWQIWRKAKAETWGDVEHVLTPDAIYKIPDADLADLAYATGKTPRQLRNESATRLLAAVLEEQDLGIVEPGVRDRYRLSTGGGKGDFLNEAMKSLLLFQTFNVTAMARHLDRSGVYPTSGGRAVYLAKLIALMTVAGIGLVWTQDIRNGRDPRPINPLTKQGRLGIASAILAGGAMGPYGNVLLSKDESTAAGFAKAVAGPMFGGEIADMIDLTVGSAWRASQGQKSQFGKKLIQLAGNNLPIISAFYIKAPLDHLILQNLEELSNPGYLARMRKTAIRTYGSDYWAPPGQFAKRAPSFQEVLTGEIPR